MLFNDVLFRIKTGGDLAKPLQRLTSDKELAKDHIRQVLGDDVTVPTLAILRTSEEIDAFDFPDACVIKPTQASGYYLIRRNGEPIPRNEIKSWLKLNHYARTREQNYRSLSPRSWWSPIAFGAAETNELKIFCYQGVPRLVLLITQHGSKRQYTFYTSDWQQLSVTLKPYQTPVDAPRPQKLDLMLHHAAALSEPFEFVRIDFYSSGDDFRIGEITHIHGNLGARFYPRGAEEQISDILFSAD